MGRMIGVFVMMALTAMSVKAAHLSAIQPGVAQHFRAGQQDMRTGHFTEAVNEFQEVLRLAPGVSEARINLGLAYHLLGNYRLAAAELEKGLEENPGVLGGNIVLGIDELKLGFPARAVPPLERAVKMSPSNQQARSSLAQAYFALGNYLKASGAYNTAFRRGSTAYNWFHLGHAYLTMSSCLTQRMAHDDANTAWTKRLAGDFLSDRQLWGDAVRRYQQALARDPSQPGLRSSLAQALLAEGNILQAQREYQSEIRRDRASPPALLGLCRVELEEGHARQALTYVSALARTAPRFLPDPASFLSASLQPAFAARLASYLTNARSEPGAHFLLAALYRSAGETAQAGEQQVLSSSELGRMARNEQRGPLACKAHRYAACAQFLDSQGHLDAEQLLVLGSSWFALRQYNQAGSAFAAALAQNQRDPAVLYWLVRSYTKIADHCFDQLARSFPGSAQAHELAAQGYRARGEDGRAIREYHIAEAIEPRNPAPHEALGELYLREHQLTGAQAELNKALELDPSLPRSLYLMGRVEIGLQKPQVAIGYLEKALSYDPHLLEARASLGLAYLRAGRPALAVPQMEESASLDYYGDLHYMLYQAYNQLGKKHLASQALAVSQALRRETEARDEALLQAAGDR